jgi:hypothetical protein
MSITRNKVGLSGALWGSLVVVIAAGWIAACGGGEGSDGDSEPPIDEREAENWESFNISSLDVEPLNPNVIARMDSLGQVHIYYYEEGDLYQEEGQTAEVRYQIRHVVWDPIAAGLIGDIDTVALESPNPSSSGDSGLNNCLVLDAGFTSDGTAVVGYQGGDVPQAENGLVCNRIDQGDLMINFFDNDWYEYTGIEGDASTKNPLFTDGYIGIAGSMAVDSQNNIHMAAQHYYEFCDWNSSQYPDLLYVMQTPGDLGHYSTSMEEYVDEHNIYSTGGGVQSSMGYHAKLVLDQNEAPLIFYVGTPTESGVGGEHRSLRMASRISGQWTPEVIEVLDNWRLETLSPAVAPDGTVAVAYYVENDMIDSNEPHHLRYAVRQADGSWQITAVDKSSYCGKYCSLAFDANSRPAIAYYDIHAITRYRERKNLKMARFTGSSWRTESVSTSGDVGLYNTLWFDAENVAYICTYEFRNRQIIIFRELTESSEAAE